MDDIDKDVDAFYVERLAEVVTIQQKLKDLSKFKEEAEALEVEIPDGINQEPTPPADLINTINARLARADSLTKGKRFQSSSCFEGEFFHHTPSSVTLLRIS